MWWVTSVAVRYAATNEDNRSTGKKKLDLKNEPTRLKRPTRSSNACTYAIKSFFLF
jgi:hypothetical protein